MAVCVDASLVAAWLLPEELSDKALLLRRRLQQEGEDFIAPSLMGAEVTSVLRKAVYRERVPLEYGEEALEAFKLFIIEPHDIRLLVDTAWSLAKALNAPHLYDMFYLALAVQEDCELWTADLRFVRMVARRFQRVRWVGNFEVQDGTDAT